MDLNPAQTALLDLKIAGIRALPYEAFFELFGNGRSPHARAMYFDALRPKLPPGSRLFWDGHWRYFAGRGWRRSFYYRGTSGLFAKLMMEAARMLRGPLRRLAEADSLEGQREIYESQIRRRLFTPAMRWFISRHATLNLVGVPAAQYQEIVGQYPGGMARYIEDCFEAVMTRLPFRTNYFWRVYIEGGYTPDACPEYLKRENFGRIKVDRVQTHTGRITEFLKTSGSYSKFVLLDHMDWLGASALAQEWEQIRAHARPGARVIFRSGGLRATYLDRLAPFLRFHPELAAQLHERGRVHTYGSFYIADLV